MTGWMSECPATSQKRDTEQIYFSKSRWDENYVHRRYRSQVEYRIAVLHGVRSHAKIVISDRSSRICFLTPLQDGCQSGFECAFCHLCPPGLCWWLLMIGWWLRIHSDSHAFSILFCTGHAFSIFQWHFLLVGHRLMAGEKIRRKKDLKQRRKLNKKL